MKPVKNEKIVHQQKHTTNESNNCWSGLIASRAARNSFVGRVFVTPDLKTRVILHLIVWDLVLVCHPHQNFWLRACRKGFMFVTIFYCTFLCYVETSTTLSWKRHFTGFPNLSAISNEAFGRKRFKFLGHSKNVHFPSFAMILKSISGV